MADIKLTDLIDAAMLQKIQDAFANATGMAALTVDLDGAVTHLSNPTEFCMKYTRGCPKGAERCNQCDLNGGEEAGRTGRPSVYFCHAGLVDFAAPILVDNRQIGSLIGGQVLTERPDEQKFRAIARDIGVDENAYIRALEKIPIVPKKSIDASANLLYVMANALSETGYQRYRVKILTENLMTVSGEMRQKITKVLHNIDSMKDQNAQLVSTIDALCGSTKASKQEANKTDSIIRYINDVSMQTRLLGFNASVEAARAGEYGKGFVIIAQEIRRLAEKSQAQYSDIDTTVQTIKNSITQIDADMRGTSQAVQSNIQVLDEIFSCVEHISLYSDKLKELGEKL